MKMFFLNELFIIIRFHLIFFDGSSFFHQNAYQTFLKQLWDLRVRGATISIKQNYSLTATAFAKDGKSVIVGGIDNNIYVSLF